MRKYAIIVAGGKGERMNMSVPKQFAELCGKPVLMHSLEAFHLFDASVKLIVVLPSLQLDVWKSLCHRYDFDIPHAVITGGASRFESVKNGMDVIKEVSIVAVHDGVRPVVSINLIERLFASAEKNGNAVPVVPVRDSLRRIEGESNMAVDRSTLYCVQTPQCFHSSQLRSMYELPFDGKYTDDASLADACGFKVHTEEGDPVNIKITVATDLQIAEMFLKKGQT